jgi:DNA-binding NarL/FixJ family response regulator
MIFATDPLSRREQEVFRLLMDGMANKEIASLLGISRKTVEEHLINIYRKLGVTSRTKAILWGIERMRDFPH